MTKIKPHLPHGWIGGFEKSNRGKYHEGGRQYAICWCYQTHSAAIHKRAQGAKRMLAI